MTTAYRASIASRGKNTRVHNKNGVNLSKIMQISYGVFKHLQFCEIA